MLKKLEAYIIKNDEIEKEFQYNLCSKKNLYIESLRFTLIYGGFWIVFVLFIDKVICKFFLEDTKVYFKVLDSRELMYLFMTIIVTYIFILGKLIRRRHLFYRMHENLISLRKNNEEISALKNEIRKQFEELESQRNALFESEKRYELAVEGADCGIWDIDVKNDIYYSSEKWKKYLGFEECEIGNTFDDWLDLIHPEDKKEAVNKIHNYILSKSEYYENTYRIMDKNKNEIWILSKAKSIRNSNGVVVRVAGSYTDITKQKLVENKLNWLAYHDKLTKLPNRFWFEKNVKKVIAENINNPSNKKFAVVYVDIDNFKNINNALGHYYGDLLLKYISKILKRKIKKPDFLASLGGDEFGIVFLNIKDEEEIINRIKKIIPYLRKLWMFDDNKFFVSYSIGVSIYPEDGENFNKLLRNSNMAMYYAKKNKKDCYCFYTRDIEENNLKNINMINDLRNAIVNNEFILVYQPIIDLENGKISGAEALIRWNHPLKGLISPGEFIPLAEEAELIYDIEKWIFREAFKQKKKLEDIGFGDVKLSINISGKSLVRNDFLDKIEELVSEFKISYEMIQFEVTETALMKDLDKSINTLNEIKNKDIKIALDDFGTGYSSLTYLKKLPIDVVKLDREFIKSVSRKKEKAIIEYVIKLTNELNLKILAEGIETQEQLEFLKFNKCNYGQGYLFSKPINKEEFEKLLELNTTYAL